MSCAPKWRTRWRGRPVNVSGDWRSLGVHTDCVMCYRGQRLHTCMRRLSAWCTRRHRSFLLLKAPTFRFLRKESLLPQQTELGVHAMRLKGLLFNACLLFARPAAFSSSLERVRTETLSIKITCNTYLKLFQECCESQSNLGESLTLLVQSFPSLPGR